MMDNVKKAIEQYHKEKTIELLRMFSLTATIEMIVDLEADHTNPLNDWFYMALIAQVIRYDGFDALDERREAVQ